jgi:CheY-like chemotaxis protein
MGKKILIAEDSSVIQNLARKILEQQNFIISTAKNGEQVLDKLEQEEYDLILMDINMPVMDGIECTRKIRSNSNPKISQLPIIAITGNAINYSLSEFEAAGINNVLQKPLNFDSMVELVIDYTS